MNGPSADVDRATTRLISNLSKDVRITPAATAIDANAALQKVTGTDRFHSLILSPTLSAEYVLQLVRTFREDGAPVAIVPVVTEAHQGLCANAVAAGADAVLLLLDGALVAPEEALDRIWHSPHRPPDEAHPVAIGAGRRALEKLQTLFLRSKSNGHAAEGDGNGSVTVPDGGHLRLRALLNDAHVARVRTESALGLEHSSNQSLSDVAEAEAPPSERPFVEEGGGTGGRTRRPKQSSTMRWKTRLTRGRSCGKRSTRTVANRPRGCRYARTSRRGRTIFTLRSK